MCEIPQGFPKTVGGVENRLYGFPCFPPSVISTASRHIASCRLLLWSGVTAFPYTMSWACLVVRRES
jgi:hypothetical protein